MQVHFFHGHDLCHAATSSPALHAKARTKRGFTNTNRRFFANRIQTIAQTHSCGRLAFTSRRRVNRCYQNQLAIILAALLSNKFSRDFGLIMTKGQQILCRNIQFCTNFLNRCLFGFPCDFNICFKRHAHSPGARLIIGVLYPFMCLIDKTV